jgi:hypothetical protein
VTVAAAAAVRAAGVRVAVADLEGVTVRLAVAVREAAVRDAVAEREGDGEAVAAR